MRKHHHSQRQSTIVNHASSGPGRKPSVSPNRRKRKMTKEYMWWDQLKQVKHLDEKKVSWRQFKEYLQDKYERGL
jgi:hypothetical protein